MKHAKKLTVFERHQLRIAKDTMRLDDRIAQCRILGGPNKEEAAIIIAQLTGRKPCTQ